MASRDFVILGTDGTRAVDSLYDEKPATVLSILDHYHTRPTSDYNNLTLTSLLDFATSKNDNEPNKAVVVIVKPYYSRDLNSNSYEQYYQQKFMLHKPFRDESELIEDYLVH